jgi:hypothetical protein
MGSNPIGDAKRLIYSQRDIHRKAPQKHVHGAVVPTLA